MTNGLYDQRASCQISYMYMNKELYGQRSVGPMSCITNKLFDQWTVGPINCITNGLYDYKL